MEKNKINIGDQYIMKKKHACGENLWTVTRTGVDIKIRCENCKHEVMLSRIDFLKKTKKKVSEYNEESKK